MAAFGTKNVHAVLNVNKMFQQKTQFYFINFAGPDNDIYCNICCHKISWPSQYAGASDTAVIPGDDGEPNACPRCGGKVCVFFLLLFLFSF